MKRIAKELKTLLSAQGENITGKDYYISPDSTLECVNVLLVPPTDSVYSHKFIRLDLVIPETYPFEPPGMFFVNYDNVRVHPNMYEDGRCCATILNTWGNSIYEKWTSSMSINTLLMSFLTFFDNDPYTHEPGGRSDDSYTAFVLHESWYACLIRYLENETDDLFLDVIYKSLSDNRDDIRINLEMLNYLYEPGEYTTPCFYIGDYYTDYSRIQRILNWYIKEGDSWGGVGASIKEEFTEGEPGHEESEESIKDEAIEDGPGNSVECAVCIDTEKGQESSIYWTTLSCGHRFHTTCMSKHLEGCSGLCPFCRREVSSTDIERVNDKYFTEDGTGKKLRKGGRRDLSLRGVALPSNP